MAAFATAEDLATFLRQDLSAADTATATQALENASEIIRNYTHQLLDEVVNDAVTLWGMGTNMLQLPETPVTAVTSVVSAGVTLDAAQYRWTPGGLLYRMGGVWPRWIDTNNTVVVTYTHGYGTIPGDIKEITLRLASQVLGGSTTGIEAESVGSYSVTYGDSGSGLGLAVDDKAVLNKYRLTRVG